jgi:hypothetical protein
MRQRKKPRIKVINSLQEKWTLKSILVCEDRGALKP